MKPNLKLIVDNSDYTKVAIYINNKYPKIYSVQESMKIAKYFVLEKGYSKAEILNGNADKELAKYVILKKMKDGSVLKELEQKIKLSLQTKKRHVEEHKVKYLIGGLVGITLIGTLTFNIINTSNNINLDDKISENLGMLASDVGSEDYEKKLNIVEQNNYAISYDSIRAENIVGNKSDELAKDIIRICTNDPKLFEISMLNAYVNMNSNRLYNMDNVLEYLKIYVKDDDAFAIINSQIQNCDVFLEYLVNKGFINNNDQNYSEIMNIIGKYKELKVKNPEKDVFSKLTKEEQELLKSTIIANYLKSKDNLYKNYNEQIENLVENEAKSNSRVG